MNQYHGKIYNFLMKILEKAIPYHYDRKNKILYFSYLSNIDFDIEFQYIEQIHEDNEFYGFAKFFIDFKTKNFKEMLEKRKSRKEYSSGDEITLDDIVMALYKRRYTFLFNVTTKGQISENGRMIFKVINQSEEFNNE